MKTDSDDDDDDDKMEEESIDEKIDELNLNGNKRKFNLGVSIFCF
jgi:hypothetical protein